MKECALAIPQRFPSDLAQLALRDQAGMFRREKQNVFLNVGCLLPSALAAEISDSETVFAGADLALCAVSAEDVFSTGLLVVFVSEDAALLVASLADFLAFLVTALVASSAWKARNGGAT